MTPQQKYKVLLVGIGLFLIVVYWLAIRKTWMVYEQTSMLQQQLSSAGQAWQDIESYHRQLQQLEAQQNNQSFTQNYLFQKVTSFCQDNRLSIRAMPESVVYQQQDVEILHNPIQVEGNFVPMVQLLYYLEQQEQLGRVVSATFNLGKNYQSRQQELTARIYLQNIQNKTTK